MGRKSREKLGKTASKRIQGNAALQFVQDHTTSSVPDDGGMVVTPSQHGFAIRCKRYACYDIGTGLAGARTHTTLLIPNGVRALTVPSPTSFTITRSPAPKF